MRRPDLRALLAVLLAAAPAGAQDAAVPGDAAAVSVDAAVRAAPGPVDPTQPLPPGHPAMGSDDPHLGGGADPAVRRASLPQSFAEEATNVPEGTIVVRVVNTQGAPVEGAPVRLGAMREGERDAPRERGRVRGSCDVRRDSRVTSEIDSKIELGMNRYSAPLDGTPALGLGPLIVSVLTI
jgi:hypothetical protein